MKVPVSKNPSSEKPEVKKRSYNSICGVLIPEKCDGEIALLFSVYSVLSLISAIQARHDHIPPPPQNRRATPCRSKDIATFPKEH